MVMVQKALLGLWKTSEIDGKSVDLTKPLTYNDRMRFRDKNSIFWNLCKKTHFECKFSFFIPHFCNFFCFWKFLSIEWISKYWIQCTENPMIIPLPSNPILIVVHWKGGLILPTKLFMTRSLKVIGKTMIHFVSMEEDLQSWMITVPFSELFKVSELLNCKSYIIKFWFN